MIINSVKQTFLEGAAATLPLGAITGGLALAVGAAVAPAVGGAAIAAVAIVSSFKIHGLIRDFIFKSRVEDLERCAKGLGLNPDAVGVNVSEQYTGGSRQIRNSISYLRKEKENVLYLNKAGDTADFKRISREDVIEAKAQMQIMARNSQPAPIAQVQAPMEVVSGWDVIRARIAALRENPAQLSERLRQKEVEDTPGPHP